MLSLRRLLSTGRALPNIQLRHATPGDLVNLPNTGKQILIGVPAAFSPGCSNSHIPGYLKNVKEFKNAGIDEINIVSVNDVFVMNAWAATFTSTKTQDILEADAKEQSYVRFLADHDGSWTKAAETGFDASKILGTHRSKRFAAIIENGQVQKLFVEPDNTGITVSAAER